jgi:hypothetical protein
MSATAETFNGTFDDAINLSDVTSLIHALLRVEAEYVEDFDYHKLNPAERIQVRIDKNNAPREMVQRYVHQMAYSQFPPVVVTADDRIIDGNTRVRARWEREERFANALVVPINYGDADDATRERILLLGRMLNNTNGKGLDKTERKLMVRDGLKLGMSERQMTGTIGFPPATVRAVKREIAGQDALVRVGLDQDLLKGSVLGTIGLYDELNEEPLRELARLVADANFGAKEAKGLAVDVKRAGSDEEALRIIRHAREGNAQRIEDVARGGVGKPKQSKQLRQRLGFITARDADVLIETDPAEMPEHLDALAQAIDVLTTTVRKQRELIDADEASA